MKRFKGLNNLMSKNKTASAERDASKNPEAFIEANKEPSMDDLKGIAFADGGSVGTTPEQLADYWRNNVSTPSADSMPSQQGTQQASPTTTAGLSQEDQMDALRNQMLQYRAQGGEMTPEAMDHFQKLKAQLMGNN